MRPLPSEPDLPPSASAQSVSSQSGLARSVSSRPAPSQSPLSHPDSPQSGLSVPALSESGLPQSVSSQPRLSDPAPSGFGLPQSVSLQSAVSRPVSSEPSLSEPAPLQSALPQSSLSGPVPLQSALSESGSPQSVPPRSVTPAVSVLARPRRVRLDRAATERIVALGRQGGVSMNGLVTAALLRAFASETAGAASGSVRLGCLYPVDMRSRLVPEVAPGDGTNMAGLASFAADIDRSVSVLDLGGRIVRQLSADLADGTVQQSVLHFPDFFGDKRTHSIAGHIAVTNTGAVPRFRTPADLTLTDYEIVYLSAHPRPSTGASAAVTFLAYTFDTHLTIGQLGGTPQLLETVHRELLTLSTKTITDNQPPTNTNP
ncbi:hypothetical protein F5X71_09705 [Nocardia brasiliensis]|uniref:Phthiocerol/phthiodiolone dimycocerosyl transferase n=2 Tax=Nocardia brasiliensis TaxID=37326 RepID=A0A6G9Y2I4_NOCBR|nr:hypothetical protein F5X71_09705 [Nocardia brasiliensis]